MLSTSQFPTENDRIQLFLGRRFLFGNRRSFASSLPSRFHLDLAGKGPKNSGDFPRNFRWFPAISSECSGKCTGSGRFRTYIFDLGCSQDREFTYLYEEMNFIFLVRSKIAIGYFSEYVLKQFFTFHATVRKVSIY